MDALYNLMTFFCATDCTYNKCFPILCPEMENEVARRHVLWRNGCRLRSVLTDSGDFVTVLSSEDGCLTFTRGRYVMYLCRSYFLSMYTRCVCACVCMRHCVSAYLCVSVCACLCIYV